MAQPANSRQSATYFTRLVDDFGIWQHANKQGVIVSDGYALDDATRGLILAVLTKQRREAEVLFNFITGTIAPDTISGFANADHAYNGTPASNDAMGQIVWAMGVCIHYKFRASEAHKLIAKVENHVKRYKYAHGLAYALLGYSYYDPVKAKKHASALAKRFADTTPEWPWPVKYMTYGNALPSYALFVYALRSGDNAHTTLAQRVLEFVEQHTQVDGVPAPIGNQGWYSRRDETPARFSQQPIEAAYSAWAWLADFKLTGRQASLHHATTWESWFHGNNLAHQSVVDQADGKCYDGIDDNPIRISSSCGAESTICYVLTEWAMEQQEVF